VGRLDRLLEQSLALLPWSRGLCIRWERGVLGVAIGQCKPADPEAKGLVERANG
jgi:hypothetical protein